MLIPHALSNNVLQDKDLNTCTQVASYSFYLKVGRANYTGRIFISENIRHNASIAENFHQLNLLAIIL